VALGVRLVEPGAVADADAVVAAWGDVVARCGEVVDPAPLPRLVLEHDGRVAGVLTFAVRGDDCEVVTIDASPPGRGGGQALMSAVVAEARERGCRRLWLVTTNDNMRAIGFYQRFGMILAAVHVGAVDDARARLKPTIPQAGADGIPIHDELVFELTLT